MKPRKIRYGVVGLGHIAQNAVLPAFANCEHSELCALISGDPEKRNQLQEKYPQAKAYSYEEFESCLQSGQIDALYIALPNHLHKEYTLLAAQNKIHVLCEKPMAVTAADCREMIHACEKNSVKLMIAYRLHFEETHLKAIHLIHHENRIGNPRIFHSIHSQVTNFPNIRTLPISQGGGPSYDMGIYDINAARYLFQAEPISVSALSAQGNQKEFEHIEESMAVNLKFPGERLASLLYGFGSVDTDRLRMVGTQGSIAINPAYTYKGNKTLHIKTEGRLYRERFKARDHFAPEIDEFSLCILEDRTPEASGIEGLADIRIIEAIYESVRTQHEIKLAPLHKSRYPQMDQESSRPAIEPPENVKTQKPTKEKAA